MPTPINRTATIPTLIATRTTTIRTVRAIRADGYAIAGLAVTPDELPTYVEVLATRADVDRIMVVTTVRADEVRIGDYIHTTYGIVRVGLLRIADVVNVAIVAEFGETGHTERWPVDGAVRVVQGVPVTGMLIDGDRLELRVAQHELVAAATAPGSDPVIGLLATGAGKTLAWQAAYIVGHRADLWTHVAAYSPRLGLATQAEADWRTWSPKFTQPRPKPVLHRTNAESLTPRGASGFASTYQSIVMNPDHHLRWAAAREGRFLLVLDEAQFLGADGEDTTQAAIVIAQMSALAARTLVLTGTPYRSDGKPLVLCDDRYDTAGGGRVTLNPDVSSRYQDCVTERTLRRFQADLIDGVTRWTEVDSRGNVSSFDLPVSQVSDGLLGRALRDPRVWKPIVDQTIVRTEEVRDEVHRDMMGLIACMDQRHARDVFAYVKERAPHLRAVMAVSSDADSARDALRVARNPGTTDILVTVRMAYIGYDAKHISVVGCLTHYRHHGHLEQLVGRALRVWGVVPYDDQTCFVVGPADPAMARFAETMRTHSDSGFRPPERVEREAGAADPENRRVVTLDEAAMSGGRTYGHDINGAGDLTADDASAIRRLMDDRGIAGVSESQAAALLRAAGTDLTEALAPYRSPDEGDGESVRYGGMTMTEARKACNSDVRRVVTAWLARKGVYGPAVQGRVREVHTRLNRVQGVSTSADLTSPSQLDRRYELAVEYVARRDA